VTRLLWLVLVGLTALAASCTASVAGDLGGTPVGGGAPLVVKSVSVTGLGPYSGADRLAGVSIDPSAEVELAVTYHPVPEDWWGEVCVWEQIFTLGLVPTYSQRPADVDVEVSRGGSVVWQKTYHSRIDVWYGWLPLLVADRFPGPDQVSVDEGSGLEGARVRAVSDRLGWRLQADLPR